MTESTFKAALANSIAGAMGILSLSAAIMLWTGVDAVNLSTLPVAADQWPGYAQETAGILWQARAAVAMAFSAVGNLAEIGAAAALAVPAAFLTGWMLFTRSVFEPKAAPYAVRTKDTLTRFKNRAVARANAYYTYCKTVERAVGHFAGAPTFRLGECTGTFKERGDLLAPSAGSEMMIDLEALFAHVLGLGGTGSGKSTGVAKILGAQILALKEPKFAALMMDGKGVLWKDFLRIIKRLKREADMRVVGLGENQYGIDLFAGLDPDEVGSVIRSAMKQASRGDGGGNSDFVDATALVFTHAAMIARAYAQTREGEAELRATGINPYSPFWLWQTVTSATKMHEVLTVLHSYGQEEADDDMKERYQRFDTPELAYSYDYLTGPWQEMAPETKSGIIFFANNCFGGFASNERLRVRFGSGNPDTAITLREVYDNGLICVVALSSAGKGGPAARMTQIMIKSLLFRTARVREEEIGKDACQAKPLWFLSDEHQLNASMGTDGLGDEFLSVARSTGTACCLLTQGIQSLVDSIGEDGAKVLVTNCRGAQIVMSNEDQRSLDHAIYLSGKQPQCDVVEPGLFGTLESRIRITGFDPMRMVSEDEGKFEGSEFALAKQALRNRGSDPFRVRSAAAGELHEVDLSHVGEYRSFGGGSDNADTINQQRRDAFNRAIDLTRDELKFGNEERDILSIADFNTLGRDLAWVRVQRAGAFKADLIKVTHDFT